MTTIDLLLACSLDAVIGDPKWLPHPVRGMSHLIVWFERGIRSMWTGRGALRVAGVVLAVGLPAFAFLIGETLIAAGELVHEQVGRGIGIFWRVPRWLGETWSITSMR